MYFSTWLMLIYFILLLFTQDLNAMNDSGEIKTIKQCEKFDDKFIKPWTISNFGPSLSNIILKNLLEDSNSNHICKKIKQQSDTNFENRRAMFLNMLFFYILLDLDDIRIFCLAVNYFDRVLSSKKIKYTIDNVPLIGITCCWLAWKIEHGYDSPEHDILWRIRRGLDVEDISEKIFFQMERKIVRILDYRLISNLPVDIFAFLMDRFGLLSQKNWRLGQYLLCLSNLFSSLSRVPATELACAAIVLIGLVEHKFEPWPQEFIDITKMEKSEIKNSCLLLREKWELVYIEDSNLKWNCLYQCFSSGCLEFVGLIRPPSKKLVESIMSDFQEPKIDKKTVRTLPIKSANKRQKRKIKLLKKIIPFYRKATV